MGFNRVVERIEAVYQLSRLCHPARQKLTAHRRYHQVVIGRGLTSFSTFTFGFMVFCASPAHAIPAATFSKLDAIRWQDDVYSIEVPETAPENQALSEPTELMDVPDLVPLAQPPFSENHPDASDNSAALQQSDRAARSFETDDSTPWLAQQTQPSDQSEQLEGTTGMPGQENPIAGEALPEAATPSDPELGNLLLRELEVPQPKPPPTVFLLGGVDYFGSDNILLDNRDPVDDQLFRYGISVLAIPALGPQTILVISAEGNLIRYANQSQLNYNELRAGVGVRQFFSSSMYGELGLSAQQLYQADGGDRLLSDYAVQLTVVRQDPLLPRLSLGSLYQLLVSFTDPNDRSRVINTLGVSLAYQLSPKLQAVLDYQFELTNYTQQSRNDVYNQVIAQLSYTLSPNAQISLFGGLSFGNSSDSDINLNSGIFGVSLDLNVPLF
jgi:hypothetical protein